MALCTERRWNAEMIEELVRLRRLGTTFAKIAKRLGVTRSAAIGKAIRIGLRVRVGGMQLPVPAGAEPEAIGAPGEILGRGVCHWIAGDVGGSGDGSWRMCGHSSVYGSLWCAHHAARVYVRVVRARAVRCEAA